MSGIKKLQEIEDSLQDLINIQCSPGNVNYDAYMHGMANGLILAKSLLDDKDPEFQEAPKFYIRDFEILDKLLESGVIYNPTKEDLIEYKERKISLPVVAKE